MCAGLIFVAPFAAAGILPVLSCVVPVATPLLTRWNDNNLYFPVIGGTVENSALWSFGGGAAVVPENEPWRVLSPLDRSSVQLSAGSTATPIRMCVPFVDDMRMFVKTPGVAGSLLLIHLDSRGSIFPGARDYGKKHTTADYWISGAKAGWILINGITIPDGRGADGTQFLTITFSTAGRNAMWRVDDILMDPWKAH